MNESDPKPFRLINETEWADLSRGIQDKLVEWNAHHALLPLSCRISKNPTRDKMEGDFFLLLEQEQPIAFLDSQELTLLNRCLFDDMSPCFNAISETQGLSLLSHLLDVSALQLKKIDPATFRSDQWFYHGSPSMCLIFGLGDERLRVMLHPQWVMRALPKPMTTHKPKVDLDDMLGSQALSCDVELSPFTLKLKEVLHLDVGDVIKTDHLISIPLLIKRHHHVLCRGELGETQHHKSIQIVSA